MANRIVVGLRNRVFFADINAHPYDSQGIRFSQDAPSWIAPIIAKGNIFEGFEGTYNNKGD